MTNPSSTNAKRCVSNDVTRTSSLRTRRHVQSNTTTPRLGNANVLHANALTRPTPRIQRLKELYAEGLAGNEHEFAAYRVLYALVTGGDVQREIRGIKPDIRDHHHLKHAMRVRMRRVLAAHRST